MKSIYAYIGMHAYNFPMFRSDKKEIVFWFIPNIQFYIQTCSSPQVYLYVYVYAYSTDNRSKSLHNSSSN